MDQLQSFHSLALAYYAIIEVIALCLLVLYKFMIYVNPATQSSQTFPLGDFFVALLSIILVGLGLLNINTVKTRNMLLGVILISNYSPERIDVQQKSILLIVGTHISILIFNLILLVFLPINGMILLVLVVMGILLIIVTKILMEKKHLIKNTTTTTCIHCHEPLSIPTYSDHQIGPGDHCKACKVTEHRITYIATVELLFKPMVLLLALYTVIVIAQTILTFFGPLYGLNSISYYLAEVFVLIALYAYILAIYIIYPVITLRKLLLLKKYSNFGFVNTIQGSSKQSRTISTKLYIEFMTTYIMMCIPVVGLLALIVMTGLALLTGIFPTASLRELLNRTRLDQTCHLGSTKTYCM